ncbi:glucuronoxylan O-methyltransferase [Salix suchowensis]|nr:glucuronoxylan O-methyltransferase [Salix suchowensis]
MRSKNQSPVNTKIIILGLFFLLLLSVIAWSSSSSFIAENDDLSDSAAAACPSLPSTPTCTKTPPSIANALVHYVTTSVTPQQTLKEISVSSRVLEKKSPCNFLIFGLGHDSLMWDSLNHGGRTVFLEEDKRWIEQIREKLPTLESYHVTYETRVNQADELIESGMEDDCKVVGDPRISRCQLALKGFPDDIYNTEWDLIMVDAPTGNRKNGETDVFVHDVDRAIEDKFSKKVRHFVIPSHRTGSGKPFCP